MNDIGQAIAQLKKELSPGTELVAVSKFRPLGDILTAYAAGQRVFAESRPQELFSKVSGLDSAPGDGAGFGDIEWHFIGHLQTNKLKMVLPYVKMVQSVDSVRLLDAIDDYGRENGLVTDILLECRIAGEDTKQGFGRREILQAISSERPYDAVRFRGLMGMASFTDDEAVIRREFAEIRDLFLEIKGGAAGVPRERLENFTELSIGMSGDYRIALEYGSTMVRIGTFIFGERS